MLVDFFLTCIFPYVWEKKFKFMIFTLLENALNPGIFTHAPIPHSKLQAEPFKICFPKQ